MKVKAFKPCLLILFTFLSLLEVKAQKPKIGIVFAADTTLVCQHVGLTIFSNKTYPLPLDIDIQKYLERILEKKLSDSYEVTNIPLLDSLDHVRVDLFDGIINKKDINKGKNSLKDNFDIVLFITNRDITRDITRDILVPSNTSGIYSQRNNVNLYSTINIRAFDLSKEKWIYNGCPYCGHWLPKLKDIKLPKKEENLDDTLLETLSEEFKNFLDQRMDYYLSKSKLLEEENSQPKSKFGHLMDSIIN